MKKLLIIIGMLSVFLIAGCVPNEPQPHGHAVQEQLSEVLLKLYYPSKEILSKVRCFDEISGDLLTEFNHTFFEFTYPKNKVIEFEGFRYNVDYFELRLVSGDIFDNIAMDNISAEDYGYLDCDVRFMPDYTIQVERWDEGFKETSSIKLYDKMYIDCKSNYENYDCSYNIGYTFERDKFDYDMLIDLEKDLLYEAMRK